jgi:hypothetical protein
VGALSGCSLFSRKAPQHERRSFGGYVAPARRCSDFSTGLTHDAAPLRRRIIMASKKQQAAVYRVTEIIGTSPVS